MFQSEQLKWFTLIAAPVLVTSLIACSAESVDSEYVQTSGIWAKM
jgi:hypothetical protein